MQPISSSIDQFIRVAKGADTRAMLGDEAISRAESLVSEVSAFLKSIDFENQDIKFSEPTNLSDVVSPFGVVRAPQARIIGKKVRGSDIVRRTAIGVFDDDAPARHGVLASKIGIGSHISAVPGSTLHTELVDFFASQGIPLSSPDDVSNFIFVNSEKLTLNTVENIGIFGHEIRTCSVSHKWSSR